MHANLKSKCATYVVSTKDISLVVVNVYQTVGEEASVSVSAVVPQAPGKGVFNNGAPVVVPSRIRRSNGLKSTEIT